MGSETTAAGLTPVPALQRLGGIARRKELLSLATRPELERAVAEKSVVKVARGRYALPIADAAQVAAATLCGVAILLSAAAHHGWATKWVPDRPQVAVPRGRRVAADQRGDVDVRWRNTPPGDVTDGWVTSPVRTVIDCAILLPFDEALAVADSALRSGKVNRRQLLAAISTLPAGQQRRARRVARHADGAAANPFESVLRAIALDVAHLRVRTQVRIHDEVGFVGRADLADEGLGIVLEGEGQEFHGSRELHAKDCLRYTRLTAASWAVLRFTWVQVMKHPAEVARLIRATVATRRGLCLGCARTTRPVNFAVAA